MAKHVLELDSDQFVEVVCALRDNAAKLRVYAREDHEIGEVERAARFDERAAMCEFLYKKLQTV